MGNDPKKVFNDIDEIKKSSIIKLHINISYSGIENNPNIFLNNDNDVNLLYYCFFIQIQNEFLDEDEGIKLEYGKFKYNENKKLYYVYGKDGGLKMEIIKNSEFEKIGNTIYIISFDIDNDKVSSKYTIDDLINNLKEKGSWKKGDFNALEHNSYHFAKELANILKPKNSYIKVKKDTYLIHGKSQDEVNILMKLLKIDNEPLFDNEKEELIYLRKKSNELKNGIEKIKKINDELNSKIKESEKINNLLVNDVLKSKELEIYELKSKYPFDLFKDNKLISVIFSFSDENIHRAIVCKNTDIFENILNSFYSMYPEYNKGDKICTVKGRKVYNDKTLEENNIQDSDIIIIEK